jgi:hypothetical protein
MSASAIWRWTKARTFTYVVSIHIHALVDLARKRET